MKPIEKISHLLEQGELNRVKEELEQLSEEEWNLDLVILNLLVVFFEEEVRENEANTVFDFSLNAEQLVKHFVRLKLLLHRLEFNLSEEYQDELYHYCRETRTSDCLLRLIVCNNMFDAGLTFMRLAEVFFRQEGKDSKRGIQYRELAKEGGHLYHG